jgi:hypothetical protein
MLQAVGEDLLAVGDRPRVAQAGEDGVAGHVEQELVTRGHGLEQGGQLQVLGEGVLVGWQRRLQVDVPVAVHEEDLHDASLRFRAW